jgi:putative transposase
MADFHFERAENWQGLLAEHERWLEGYNTQRHWANEGRWEGRRRPSEVLGSLTVVRHHPEDLSRAFFSSRFVLKLDVLGYARFRRWRVYAEEGLARLPVALWLGEDDLTVRYDAHTLSSYNVFSSPGETKLRAVTNPRLFVTRHQRSRPLLKLVGLEEAL